jgi:hypothetical protein
MEWLTFVHFFQLNFLAFMWKLLLFHVSLSKKKNVIIKRGAKSQQKELRESLFFQVSLYTKPSQLAVSFRSSLAHSHKRASWPHFPQFVRHQSSRGEKRPSQESIDCRRCAHTHAMAVQQSSRSRKAKKDKQRVSERARAREQALRQSVY